jgi:hypothetical protein
MHPHHSWQLPIMPASAYLSPMPYGGRMPSQFLDIDPRRLRVPPTRPTGADPFKLHRQIGLFGKSTDGMPPIVVYRGLDGEFMIFNGVTRATRIAKLSPGTFVRVEIIGRLKAKFGQLPTVEDLLP